MKILTVSNKVPTEPYYCWAAFHESLRRFGFTPIVLGMGEHYGGLMTRPRKEREWLRAHPSDEVMIICDSWDLVFARSPVEIEEAFEQIRGGGRLVWNAEKTFFPFDPALDFPDPGTPYRYLNSGFAVGPASAHLELLESLNLDSIPDDHVNAAGQQVNPFEQPLVQQAFCKGSIPMTLDTHVEICQCLHAVTPEELDLTGDQIRNTITNTHPMVFHMNGAKEPWKDKILNKLAL
jgi:hypothetical protein